MGGTRGRFRCSTRPDKACNVTPGSSLHFLVRQRNRPRLLTASARCGIRETAPTSPFQEGQRVSAGF